MDAGRNIKRYIMRIIPALFLLFISAAVISAEGNINEVDNISIKITANALFAGRPIETALFGIDASDVIYGWSVAGEDTGVHTAAYTPTAADYEAFITVSVSDAQGGVLASDSVYFSPLPVIYIDTHGVDIVSRSEYIAADMKIQGNYDGMNLYDGEIEIKGRGTSSWHYDKKPYKIKLDKKTDLFGFGESKHYILLANYLDPSLMRNAVGYGLSACMGLTATDFMWTDVVCNGVYAGNYLLCEQIRIGEQLIDITDWEDIAGDAAEAVYSANSGAVAGSVADLRDFMTRDLSWVTSGSITYCGATYKVSDYISLPDSITGGYLFELDSSYQKGASHFMTENGIKVIVSEPEYLYTNTDMTEYVTDYLNGFEDAVTSIDGYGSDGVHYTELADFDSMVAYWLTNEILGNEDAATRSRFCYKPINDKLVFGPVWDFDIGGGSFRSFFGARQWSATGTVVGFYEKQDIWVEFIDDPYFQIKAQEKYWSVRGYLRALIEDGGIIDSYNEYLYESGAANELLWSGDGYMSRTFTGASGDVAVYKNFLSRRLDWLDSVFDTEESTAKALRSVLSATPYKKSRRISLRIESGCADTTPHGAEYVVDDTGSFGLTIDTVSGGETQIYINGIRYKDILCDTDTAGGKASYNITIPVAALTEERGSKNVISVITRIKDKVYTNYTTVKVRCDTDTGDDGSGGDTDITFDYGNKCVADEHDMTHIAPRTATAARYGLNECFYCNACRRYFADIAGEVSLRADEAIIAYNSCGSPGGLLAKVRLIASITISALVILIISTVILIKKLKRRKCKPSKRV